MLHFFSIPDTRTQLCLHTRNFVIIGSRLAGILTLGPLREVTLEPKLHTFQMFEKFGNVFLRTV